MRSRRVVSLFLLLAALGLPRRSFAGLFPSSPFSREAVGTTGAIFLKLPASARALALGSAYVAASDDAESMFWNPAGLAQMQDAGKSELALGYNALLETSYSSSFAYARPFSEDRGVLGASLVYFSQSSLKGYSSLGDPAGDFQPYDMSLAAGYAKKFGNIGAGASLKFIRSKLADATGTTFAVDVGVQIERFADVGEGPLDFGASFRNLGPAIRLGGVADPLPFELQLGALWHISPNFRGLLDGHLPVDESPYPSIGAEWGYDVGEGLDAAVRAGFNVRNDRDIEGLTGFTAGFGLGVQQFRVDYAWVPLGDLGTTHRMSLGFNF